MCNKADCINWDSDAWGGHCMCLEPPCQNPFEWPDEHGIPKLSTFSLTKVYKNRKKHRYGTLDLTYDTQEQLKNNFADFVNEYGNEDGKIDYWELRNIKSGETYHVHAPRYKSVGKSSPQRADG